jgi:4-hydroxy-tetrahydrodipicolinate reductase
VYAPNTSIGVAVLSTLVRRVAGLLGTAFDIEIIEMHHRNKQDAPSGTALHLGEQAAAGRQIPFAKHAVRARDGMTGPRRDGDIGFATLRGGSVVAEHSVIFAGPSERLVLSHIAEQRDLFAYGALYAARWLRDRAPGIYSMEDVLGLS